jgi:hypothetical protein
VHRVPPVYVLLAAAGVAAFLLLMQLVRPLLE